MLKGTSSGLTLTLGHPPAAGLSRALGTGQSEARRREIQQVRPPPPPALPFHGGNETPLSFELLSAVLCPFGFQGSLCWPPFAGLLAGF